MAYIFFREQGGEGPIILSPELPTTTPFITKEKKKEKKRREKREKRREEKNSISGRDVVAFIINLAGWL